jgi:phosphatidylserine synthase
MGLKILIAAAIAWWGGFVLAPDDVLSALVYGTLAAFLCAVPLLILGRFAFVKTASKSMHTLVCSLVCLAAILFLMCYMLTLSLHNAQRRLYRTATSSPDASVRVENASDDAPAL